MVKSYTMGAHNLVDNFQIHERPKGYLQGTLKFWDFSHEKYQPSLKRSQSAVSNGGVGDI